MTFETPLAAPLADLLAGYCLEVREGQQILVRSTTAAAPLLLEVQRAVLERGGWPLLRIAVPGEEENFYRHAQEPHLDSVAPLAAKEATEVDALLSIIAPDNTFELARIEPKRLARAARAREPLMKAAVRNRLCVTLWPTPALAQQAAMSTSDLQGFVAGALFLDKPNPEAAWQRLRSFQARLIDDLEGANELRIQAEGTDLRLRVDGRTWVNSDGRRNMPSGEVFTGPIEDSAEGQIRYTVPTSPSGVEVRHVELEFRQGEVVAARAERGQGYLEAMLGTDPGARRLGEVGIGTNTGIDRPTGMILLDEKIGGTVHTALGRSFPETGGVNESAIHWDLICDLREGGQLSVDGEVVQADGAFRRLEPASAHHKSD